MGIESQIKDSETTQNESDYNYNGASTDLLSQWLNSLETRSSLFWLHYVECNFKDGDSSGTNKIQYDQESDEGAASLTNSSEYTDSGLENCNSLTDNDADDKESSKNVSVVPECKSIAHRDSELLLALTENCSHGPVCYFCRYTKN